MPIRDYELVQKAKRDGWVKISIKCLLRPLECDPVACQGLCCSHLTGNLFPTFHPEEIKRLPTELRQFVNEDGTTKVKNQHCPLIPYCIKDPNIMTAECRLAPLGFNSAGRLILKRWAWVKPCPAYNKGRPIYIAMKHCLVDMFGENVYKEIVEEIEYALDTPPPKGGGFLSPIL